MIACACIGCYERETFCIQGDVGLLQYLLIYIYMLLLLTLYTNESESESESESDSVATDVTSG